MKIEFNGRAVASFCLGLVVGAIGMGIGFAFGPIGRIQRERDDSKQKLAEMTVERDRLVGVSQQMFRRINELTAQRTSQVAATTAPAPQDPAVQVLNAIRPGLGTAAGILSAAAQKAQANQQALAAQQAAANQQAMTQALQKEQTEKHCPSGHCAACPEGWKLFDAPQETYCVPAGN